MLDRRQLLGLFARGSTAAVGLAAGLWSRRAAGLATPLVARTIASRDAAALQTIMTVCVADGDSFFGKCGEWSRAWADDLVVRCPDSVVLTAASTTLAFLEIPPIRAPLAPLAADASLPERERHAARQRNRTTFRVNAAGVRDDVLTSAQAVRTFRALLYRSFVRARELGYETVEAVAPWERHPRLTKKFTAYPGCALVEPVSRAQGGQGLVLAPLAARRCRPRLGCRGRRGTNRCRRVARCPDSVPPARRVRSGSPAPPVRRSPVGPYPNRRVH